MTVKELKEVLNKCDDNTTVFINAELDDVCIRNVACRALVEDDYLSLTVSFKTFMQEEM